MTELDLTEIRNRAQIVESIALGPNALLRALASARDVPALLAEVERLRAAVVRQCADDMYRDAYHAINKLMDKAHGSEESDGAGAGLLEDVALVVAQRDDARAKLAACIAGRYELQFGPVDAREVSSGD